MFEDRYSRQIRFEPIGQEGQLKLAGKRVMIVGMGALGTVLAQHMVRAGVGRVTFVDRDFVEPSNLQRQVLFDENDAIQALPKAAAAERKLRAVNSDVAVEGIVADYNPANAELLTGDADLVLDGTDNFHTRFLINDVCFKKGIPYLYGGVVGSRGMSAAFLPGRTACLRCMIEPAAGTGETCDTAGVLSMAVDVTASFQAAEALKLLVEAQDAVRIGMHMFDVWGETPLRVQKLPAPAPSCPTCGLRQFPALNAQETDGIVVLCGRDTVQMDLGRTVDLSEWKERLQPFGGVESNPFLLKAQLPGGEGFVLFRDGRVLIRGTSDIVRAKSIFARFFGG